MITIQKCSMCDENTAHIVRGEEQFTDFELSREEAVELLAALTEYLKHWGK